MAPTMGGSRVICDPLSGVRRPYPLQNIALHGSSQYPLSDLGPEAYVAKELGSGLSPSY